MKNVKVYVQVNTNFNHNGLMLPREWIREDGEKYTICRMIDFLQAAAMKVGGLGNCYTYEISAETDLYIFAYLCNDRCFRWQTCDREFVMREKENARCGDKPRVRLMDYYNATILTKPYSDTNP